MSLQMASLPLPSALRLLSALPFLTSRRLHTFPRRSVLSQTHTIPASASRHITVPLVRHSVRTIFIQTERTTNPDALKFVPGTPVLPAGASSIDYLDGRDTHNSPLARKLFAVHGVRAVFYGPDFITITKTDDTNWAFLKPEVFSLITECLNSGDPVVTEGTMQAEDTMAKEGDGEVVAMIKELLDTRIRPSIQEDGGDIEYKGFEGGYVLLKLRGACRTCDSSTVTLKNGIESMLMHYIEEVQGVTQVLDQEEEVAMREFEKFEERLRKVKGPTATAGTSKGGLDAVPA